MTIIDLILNIIRQFGLVGVDKLRDLTAECDEFEKSASDKSENQFKKKFAAIHYGEYGLAVRLFIPIVYFFLRAELSAMEKTDDDIL